MDGSYLNRWASWVARWLVASMVVTVGACSWSPAADRGGPLLASHACAETSMWDSVPLPGAFGPSANLLTVSGGGHIAFERSPDVAGHVTLYLVELRVSGGHAC